MHFDRSQSRAHNYRKATEAVLSAFHHLESRVPGPKQLILFNAVAWRYEERSIEQASLAKLARYASGMSALDVLLERGFIQEAGALKRMLDEISNDLWFLAACKKLDCECKECRQYLDEFWQEEFDQPTAVSSTQKRHRVPLKSQLKIINRAFASDLGEHASLAEINRTIHYGYAGYVHSAAFHIMEMIGDDGRYQVPSMRGSYHFRAHIDDAVNHFYRGIHSAVLTAIILEAHDVADHLMPIMREAETKLLGW